MAKSFPPRFKRIIRSTFRIVLKIVSIFLLLAVICFILLQTSFVQNYAREKIQAYLEAKLHTKVVIGELSIDFPNSVVLKNIYLEDQHHDSLLYAGLLSLDLKPWGLLFNHKLVVYNIRLDRWTVNMQRIFPDSGFNYDFIARAFVPPNAEPEKAEKGKSKWVFQLDNICLTNIRAHYRDDASGNDLSLFLPYLRTKMKTFDPDQLIFAISDLSVKGLNGHLRNYKPAMLVQREKIGQS